MKSGLAFASGAALAWMAATPIHALAADPNISMEVKNGSADMRTTAHYDCAGKPLEVEYLNVEPDHLAVLPVEGQRRIFVLVMSASGARYASGQYIWWTKGPEAWLYDRIRGDDADPVLTCSQ